VPLYEYACANCGHRFEVRQRVVDEPISVCPKCGGPTRRVFHPVGIIFKGSGWYSTDSRKSESATTASADKAPAEKAGAEKAAAEKPSTDGAKASPAPSTSPSSSEGSKASPAKSSD